MWILISDNDELLETKLMDFLTEMGSKTASFIIPTDDDEEEEDDGFDSDCP